MGETKVPDPFAKFMKVSSILLSMSQSDSGMAYVQHQLHHYQSKPLLPAVSIVDSSNTLRTK